MKHENPIEEIWRIRDGLGTEEGYDVRRLFERLRREEAKYADRLVYPVSRRTLAESPAVLREEPPKST